MHSEAEAGDDRKGAATPDGNHGDVEGPGPYLEPISVFIVCSDRSQISVAEDKEGGLGGDL